MDTVLFIFKSLHNIAYLHFGTGIKLSYNSEMDRVEILKFFHKYGMNNFIWNLEKLEEVSFRVSRIII